MKKTLSLIIMAVVAVAVSARDDRRELMQLWYDRPATQWLGFTNATRYGRSSWQWAITN